MSRHKVLCRDKEWPQQGLFYYDRVGYDRGSLSPTTKLSAPMLARTSSQMISYGNVATWLSLLHQCCMKAHCRDKEFHIATELSHGRRFPCRDLIFYVTTEFGS